VPKKNDAVEKLAFQVMDDLNRAYSVEIPDEQHVHLVDDGAFVEVMDRDLIEGDTPTGVDSAFQTDFEHEFEMREAAYKGPDGQKLDDLDHAINLRHMQREEAAKEAPHRNINPPSWDRGKLGGGYLLRPGVPTSAAGLQQLLVHWPGDDREVVPVVVTANPLNPLPTSGFVLRPFINVKWGNNNGEFEADIDVGTGVQLAISASSVYVTAGLDALSTTDLFVSAAIGFYSADKACQAARTSYLDAIASGATTAGIARPRFATTIASFLRSDVANAYTLNLKDANGTIIGAIAVAANTIVTNVPLPNDCRTVDVVNGGAGGSTPSARLVWGLSF
jgi:hypothetical protein